MLIRLLGQRVAARCGLGLKQAKYKLLRKTPDKIREIEMLTILVIVLLVIVVLTVL